MNIVMIGGSHGIGFEYYKKMKNKGDNLKVLSREQLEVAEDDWLEFDVMKFISGEKNFPQTFECIDCFIYLPGSVNLGVLTSFKAKDFLEDYKLSVVGAYETMKACLPNLKNSDKASINFFSSVVAQTGMSLHSLVGTNKGAIEGLTRNLAAELAPKIRVNALALSLVETPLSQYITDRDKAKEASIKKHPLKKIGDPSEVADMLQVLTHFSPWMTGQIISYDGGISAVR